MGPDSQDARRQARWIASLRTAPVAQWQRQRSQTPSSVGSNPTRGTHGSWLVERRLSQNGTRLKSLRAELAQIDEQLAVFADDADDTAIRALVSETPGAAYEANDARKQRRSAHASMCRATQPTERRDKLIQRSERPCLGTKRTNCSVTGTQSAMSAERVCGCLGAERIGRADASASAASTSPTRRDLSTTRSAASERHSASQERPMAASASSPRRATVLERSPRACGRIPSVRHCCLNDEFKPLE